MATITVASYNIRRGLGMDGRVDMGRIADLLRGTEADVIVLNEVERFGPRAGFRDQADTVAGALGMRAYPCAAFTVGPYRFGNAILTCERAISHGCVCLPRASKRELKEALAAERKAATVGPLTRWRRALMAREPRSAGVVRLMVGDVQWAVVGPHLGLTRGERAAQAAYLADLVLELGPRVIVAGDLNAGPDAKELAPLLQWAAPQGRTRLLTFPSHAPDRQLDHVLAGPGCAIIRARTYAVTYSDHLPIVAVVS